MRAAPSEAGVERFVSFGEHAKADARLVKFALQADSSTVQARILGADVTYKLGAPGRHVVLNSLAVLAAAALAGADLALAALALSALEPPAGRGARLTLRSSRRTGAVDRRELQRQSGLDAGGARAARPGARSARAAGASRCSAKCWSSVRKAAELHRGLLDPIVENAVDLVFCAGPLFAGLWEALPSERRGGYAVTSAALEAQVLGALRAGDAIMVKGSLGSKMGPIVKALTRQFSSHDAREAASAQG